MSNDVEILFEPFSKQQEFLEAVFGEQFDVVLYGGAIKGGKTFAGLGALLLLAKIYPGSRWAVVRQDLPTLKKNTIPTFNKIKPANFIRRFNQETQVVTFTNGSELIFFPEGFKDDKDLDRWKGLDVNGFLLEEIDELQEASFYKAIERAGSWVIKGGKTPPPLILATCNPSQGYVKNLFYDPWKKGTLPKRWHYIQSRIFDNPYMPEKYVQSLKQLPKYEYAVFVEGDWEIKLMTGGEFYKCFSLERNVKALEYEDELPLHITFDENVNPFMTLNIWQGEGSRVFQIDEICSEHPNNTLRLTCNEFKRRYPPGTIAGLFVYGDATSKKADVKLEKGYNFYKLIARYLKAYYPRFRVPKANPSIVMRGNFINTIFETNFDSIYTYIGDNCKRTIADYTNVKEAADGSKQKAMETDPKTKVRYQKWGHTTDANDYFLCQYFKESFTLYQRGRKSGIADYIFGEREDEGKY